MHQCMSRGVGSYRVLDKPTSYQEFVSLSGSLSASLSLTGSRFLKYNHFWFSPFRHVSMEIGGRDVTHVAFILNKAHHMRYSLSL